MEKYLCKKTDISKIYDIEFYPNRMSEGYSVKFKIYQDEFLFLDSN